MTSGGEKRSPASGPLVFAIVSALAALVVLAAAIVVLTDSPQAESLNFADSPYPNVDLSNSRHAQGPIRAATVSEFEIAWSLPMAGREGSEGSGAMPVVSDGVAYMQDLDSNVQAIELSDGKLLWEKTYDSKVNGRNGVVVAEGRVYGAADGEAFALDQRTGEEVWATRLVRNDREKIATAPNHHGGLVYLSTAPDEQKGGEVGVLWALDAGTGRKVWGFDTVPRDLWGNRKVNFGGGVSYPPSFDDEGSMYVGIGNPGPIPGTEAQPWGSSRPGPNLYTSSVVKLDAKSGELRWYHQVTPHALCNWDVGSTILVRSGGRDLVVAGGLSGIVVALDRQTGELVWKRSVGRHNGHDDDGLLAMRGEYSTLKTPVSVYPGVLGGVFGSPATDGSTVFVPVVDFATRLLSQSEAAPSGSSGGELVALDVVSGAVKWKHDFSTEPAGATTTVNDLVFSTTLDGTLYAFDSADGELAWKAELPTGSNTGITVSGATLLAPAGNAEAGRAPELTAYRLSG